ncbi:hypothetical protein [Bacillus niameyensis]|uniref:hypothetical protein n=1 Tax=Bacillus niameyensis TaxID=1522308 RepID=UPI000781CA87|nr:hypothetical protein [Bacillus niameyensis]
MTAEIVVMNTKGIALATDSAVTIAGRKVYNSANKLFELSKHNPVGVMFYESVSLLNVPWETLIKIYRNKLDDHQFDTLNEYVEAFLHFLNENEYKEFMSKSNEENFIRNSLQLNVSGIHSDLSDLSMTLYSEYGELNLQNDIQELYIHHGWNYLRDRIQSLEEKKYIDVFNNSDFNLLIEKYGAEVEELIHKQFENHLLIEEWTEEIKYIVIQALLKDFPNNYYSGIVFAGFGSKEIYPSVITLKVDGKINGKIKYSIMPHQTKSISNSLGASIIPLAQRDMVENFLTGIHIEMQEFVFAGLEREFEGLSHTLTEKLKDSFKEETNLETIEDSITDELLEVYRRFNRALYHYKRKNFIDPIVDIVEALPVEELAEMAEALLSITSLKRKMSISLETVGGPIDVALITKGDGFTWVKRK